MKNNIVIIICLMMMAVAAIFAIRLYANVEAEKKKTDKALLMLTEQQKVNDTLRRKSDSLTNALSDLIAKSINTNETTPAAADTAKIALIRKIRTVSEDYTKANNIGSYEKAVQLEKEGFEAISKNQLGIALEKFNQIEKIAPSFHSSYEISKLLNSKKNNFSNPGVQKEIKELIIKKYYWKAPPEQMKKIEIDVRQSRSEQLLKPDAVKLAADTVKKTHQPVKVINKSNLNYNAIQH